MTGASSRDQVNENSLDFVTQNCGVLILGTWSLQQNLLSWVRNGDLKTEVSPNVSTEWEIQIKQTKAHLQRMEDP